MVKINIKSQKEKYFLELKDSRPGPNFIAKDQSHSVTAPTHSSPTVKKLHLLTFKPGNIKPDNV
jgi:hypothetical protein